MAKARAYVERACRLDTANPRDVQDIAPEVVDWDYASLSMYAPCAGSLSSREISAKSAAVLDFAAVAILDRLLDNNDTHQLTTILPFKNGIVDLMDNPLVLKPAPSDLYICRTTGYDFVAREEVTEKTMDQVINPLLFLWHGFVNLMTDAHTI
eukprot:COSAG01_NODE_5842_length_4001_cov_13.893388_2_plen_153_part_00